MSTAATIKPPVIVRTASGRMARCVLEAYDEAETLYLIEHHDKQQELRRKTSITPISGQLEHIRSQSEAVEQSNNTEENETDESDLWDSEVFEPGHVRTKSGREALCIGVEDHGESFVVLEYSSGRTVVKAASTVTRLEKSPFLVSEEARKKQTNKLFKAVQRHSVFDVERLLDRQADVNGKDSIGFSPLLWAIQHNRYDIMKVLIDRNADPTAVDNTQASTLMWALRIPCHLKIISELVKYSSLNNSDETGATPLITSCRRSYKTMTQMLIDHGASTLNVDSTQKTAVDWAVKNWGTDHEICVQLSRRFALESTLIKFLPPDLVFLILTYELDVKT